MCQLHRTCLAVCMCVLVSLSIPGQIIINEIQASGTAASLTFPGTYIELWNHGPVALN